MKNKNLIFLISFFLAMASTSSAQTAVVGAGGEATGSGGTVSYSVGQVVYQTNNGTTYNETQGVQQPYEISVVTGDVSLKGINLSCKVYPNPSTTYLQLEIKNENLNNLQFQLFDITGKLLQTEQISASTTKINMADYPASTYLLQVMTSGETVQTFKIIKIQ
jgi:opacity protein-like surface antigen